MISEDELLAVKTEAVQALVHAHTPSGWPGTIAEPGPQPIFPFFPSPPPPPPSSFLLEEKERG